MHFIKWIGVLLPVLLWCEESFITPYEYGKMLYQNPRGIGCHHCHGTHGEGAVIATYRHKGKHRSLRAPQINNMIYFRFYRALQENNKIMPKYHLTEQEIKALYLYLSESNKGQT